VNRYLLKSEPDAFSWAQQQAVAAEPWTGVRNAQAAAVLTSMAVGDQAFFYHSNVGKEIVGIVEVVRPAYPDPTDGTGRWVCVDVRAMETLPRPVTLAAIKAEPRLEGMGLIRQSRLSCMAVSPEHWAVIRAMGGLA
jgi:predicted RNA-binding protein with PUA-like domain